MCRCWASRICCWRRYCWCNAWGRKGGAGMSWNWGAGMGLRGGWSGGPCWWPGGARWGFMPDCGCPGWGMGKSMGSGVWGPNWKCRQEVAWLCCCCCCCRLKWDPVEDKERLSGTRGERLARINCGWNVESLCVWHSMLMKPYLLPRVKNTSVGVGKMMITTSTMNMTTIFCPARKMWAFISLIVFPTSGSTSGLPIHRQVNWTQHSSVLVNSAADSGSARSESFSTWLLMGLDI